ncbi:MAG: hypothetical protein RL757_607, partial [Bacteroidota bacterium]
MIFFLVVLMLFFFKKASIFKQKPLLINIKEMTSITEISYDRISGDGGTLDSYDECKQSYFKDNIICLSKKTNNDTLFLVPKSAYMNKKVEELLHGQLILVVKDACYDLHTGKFHILGDYYSLNIGVLSRWLTKSVLR